MNKPGHTAMEEVAAELLEQGDRTDVQAGITLARVGARVPDEDLQRDLEALNDPETHNIVSTGIANMLLSLRNK